MVRARDASPARQQKRSRSGSLGSSSRAALVALPYSEYAPQASLMDDMRTLSVMWFGSIAGDTHQDRLESFYKNQAELYDGYRARMLHARKPMMTRLMVERDRKGDVVWVDLGGGTGANVEFMDSAIKEGWFKQIVVLDLAPSLCQVARKRAEDKWPGVVSVVCGDACNSTEEGLPDGGTCDIVTISYALVMIPDWKAAVQNALRLLRPGGHLCVCDFTVLTEEGGQWPISQGFWTRTFATDHVHLKAEHRQYLKSVTTEKYEETGYGRMPYIPFFLRPAWYAYIGVKP
mmetsp:Transcript_54545/g.88412  ORF Transcript_54545/g.88412 Transcript_54545/m.88412 type:complete len:289 (-) Transcript_54545:428-1294(-)